MEWTESLKSTVAYIEEHILEDITADDVAEAVHISSFYLQKGFSIVTGYSIGEYIRNRRLYLAALDVAKDKEKIIDIAYKYCYETPESFTRAFARFHGVSPVQIKKDITKIKNFQPLRIVIDIKGGNDMDVIIEKMSGFKVVGFEREFSTDNAWQEIPKFWDEYLQKYIAPIHQMGMEPQDKLGEIVKSCHIGEFGICIDDGAGKGKFRYMIAGTYHGEDISAVNEELKNNNNKVLSDKIIVCEFKDMEWAKFNCVGAMPTALQTLNNQIFKEWLPGNPDFEVAQYVNIEWYTPGDMSQNDYKSGVWIPVKRK